ncbi:hypothetical protein DTO212C5_3246 [Paecilomyces variotii]|nr:hypothetical protein DTO212C5_3246 [Paecilomyces variotii]
MHCILTLYTVKGSQANIDSCTCDYRIKIHASILATIIAREDIVDYSIVRSAPAARILKQVSPCDLVYDSVTVGLLSCASSPYPFHRVSYRSRGQVRTFSCHSLDIPPEIALGTDAARKKFPPLDRELCTRTTVSSRK